MALVGDERGQSVQIGAVLLFGVLILSFSSYQAFVIPEQNSEVEFSHNQDVHSQLLDLRNAIVAVPGTTSTQAVSVTLGTRYPSRVLARNPGPPAGSLRTNGTETDANNITIRHASASGEVGDYWTGSTPRKFGTGAVVYTPNYNVYDNAPTTYYEHSVAYNQFRSGNITLSEQAIVDGRQVTLVALNGSMRRSSSGTTAVDVRPVSQSSQTITVTNDQPTTRVSISVLTRLPESVWEDELLAEEFDSTPGSGDDDRYITAISATNGPGPFYNLTITFEQGVDYQIRLAKAGLGTKVEDVSAAYLTDISGDGETVTRGDSTEIVLEVRDKYNNPNQSTTVVGEVEGTNNGRLEPIQQVSDEDGRVRFRYETFQSNTTGTHQLNFSYKGLSTSFDRSTPENVSMNVTMEKSGSNNGGGGGSNTGFVVNIESVDSPVDQGETVGVEIEVENTGESQETQTITLAAEDQNQNPGQVDSQSVTLNAGQTQTITLDWDTGATGSNPGEYDLKTSIDGTTYTNTTTVNGVEFTGDSATAVECDCDVFFYTRNERSDKITLESVTVESTDTDTVEINWDGFYSDAEVWVDLGDDGSWDQFADGGPYSIGDKMELDNQPPSAPDGPGSTARWGMGYFYDTSGNEESMIGAQMKITIRYSVDNGPNNGNEYTSTFTIDSVESDKESY